MDKKDFIVISLKVIVYACTLVLAALGAVAMTSCSVQKETSISGKAIIVTTDTTYIHHSGFISYPKK